MRGTLHAARAELRIAEPVACEGLFADLAQGVAAGGELVVCGRRGLAAEEGGHSLPPKIVEKMSAPALGAGDDRV